MSPYFCATVLLANIAPPPSDPVGGMKLNPVKTQSVLPMICGMVNRCEHDKSAHQP